MEYYYTSSNHQDYPLNYPYNNQPYNDYHHNYYYSSSSFDESKSDTPGIPLKLNYEFPSYDEYGGYSNEPPIRYDYDNYTQFHSNPYEHFPAQSLTVYQYNSSYDDHPLELPAKKGSNFLDPVSTTGFVISYSNTEPKPDLEFEEFDLRNFHGGYSIEETYGKPLPPSEEICYPPSKFDPTPPPLSPFGEGEKNLSKTPELKEEEDQASEPEEYEDDDEEEEEEEEEEHEEENRGVLIVPLPGMGDQAVNEEEEEEDDDDDDDDDEEEDEIRGVLVAPPLLRKEDQGVNEAEEEEEESSNSEGYEEGEEEEKRENLDGGRVEEKEIKRQIVPPGYGLQAMDLCEGVFGGYFPCLRKRSNLQGTGDQSNSGNSNTIGSGNSEFFSGDCWNTTVDYLFGDPDPYARALPDPIYGYHRYYPQQPISGQIDYGEDHSWMDNSSYYNYECNGGGY